MVEFALNKKFKRKKEEITVKRGILSKIIDKIKEIREELYMDNDLLFTTTYMASISTAEVSREKIFEKISERKEYATSKYFKKIRDLAKVWNYDYATACKEIAKKVKNKKLKEFLNRYANAITSGEPDSEFLESEWKTFKTVRKDEYLRSLDTLRKWTDAYTAMLVSMALVSIIILLSVIIYNVSTPEKTLYTSAIFILITAIFGVGIMYKAVPKDIKTHDMKIKSKEQRIMSKLAPIVLPISIIVFITFCILSLKNPQAKTKLWGLAFILSGIPMIPVGILAKIDDRKISERDEKYTIFIRNLGAIVGGSRTTIVEALKKIDLKNLGMLKDSVKLLYRRLAMGLDDRISWERFVGESGSYLIQKFTGIFIDAVDLGGDATRIGNIVSSSNLEMVLLRMKRNLIASGFTGLIVPLHIAMVSLIMFITTILALFSGMTSNLFSVYGISGEKLSQVPATVGGLNLGLFGGIPMELLYKYAFIIILIITVSNLLVCRIVTGTSNYMHFYYGAIFFILSGIIFIAVPKLVDIAFSLPSFIGSKGGGGGWTTSFSGLS